MSSYNHFGCSWCGGPFNGGNCPGCSRVGSRNEFVYDPNPYSYNETPNFFNQPRQHQYEAYSSELCGDGPHYGFDCQTRTPLFYEQEPCYNQNFSDNYYPQNSSSFPQQYLCCENCGGPHKSFQCQPRNQNYFEPNPCYDPNSSGFDKFQPSQSKTPIYYDDNDDEESSTPLRDIIISELPPRIAITPVLSTEEPKDSLIMRDEHLDTIPEKESDEFIKSSVENLVPNPSESEDTSGSDSECILPLCDDFSPINVFEEKSVTFSNPLFEFNDEYISSDVNPLFDELLENIKIKDSYDSNLDEPDSLVTPLSDANKDECFDPGGDIDEIDAILDADVSTDIKDGYHDSEGDIIYLESLLLNDTILNLPPKVFLDHDPRSFKDEPDNYDFKSMVKVFDLGIHDQIFSPTYVSSPFTDHHYLFHLHCPNSSSLFYLSGGISFSSLLWE
nr:hypothetical protein [Tanacetum cinerariifolium]